MRMLITSAGRRAELLQCFRSDAGALGISLEILACDLNPEWSAACRLADQRLAVPRVDDPGYIDALLNICRNYGVSLLVPTIDPELLPLAQARGRFAEIETHVALCAPALVDIARHKLKTARFFASNGIATPRTALAEDARDHPAEWDWPLIIKARHGSASRGLKQALSADDLPDLSLSEPLVAQQLLKGREFTINMFFSRQGGFHTAIPHERMQVRAGEVEKGVTRRVPALADVARRIAQVLPGPSGVLCFQAIIGDDGKPWVFEINARFGGGFPLAHHAGACFSRWLLEEQLGRTPTAHDDWREGITMMRYDAAVFASS